jgi:GTP-binding protein
MKQKYKTLAIVGRPNVGKSTLFNRLLKERKSIVDDLPGVTRDRIYADIVWNGKGITLVDTGGLIDELEGTENEITQGVKKQVYSAVEEADFVIFVVDGKSGLTAQDTNIAKELRKVKNKKKVFLAVNKIDTDKQLDLIHDFHSIGLGEPYAISALAGSMGLADILDEIANASGSEKVPDKEPIKICIVGKPNVGKSSFLNCLTGENRAIVTPVPGTTRDCIDTKVTVHGEDFILVDTAGLRRKSKVSTNIERFATTRTIAAIEKSDIVVFMVDINEEITDQDQKIANVVKRRNKASIIVGNKWDLIEDKSSTKMNSIEEYILAKLHFINYSKILFTSVTERKNTAKIWEIIKEVYKNYEQRVSTSKLNKTIEDIVLATSPPTKKGKSLKIYYATQANNKPPEIVLFVNDAEIANEQYERFLEKEIRKCFDLTGSPIKLIMRNKKK